MRGVVPDMERILKVEHGLNQPSSSTWTLPVRFRWKKSSVPSLLFIHFDTEEDAIEIANGTKYGLASTIWTQNLEAMPTSGSRNGYGARLGQHMASSRFADTIWWNEKQRYPSREGGITLSTFTAIRKISVFRCLDSCPHRLV